jgi:hypothetical protein
MSVIQRLEQARRELLDLRTRNRLLNTPRGDRIRAIQIVDERADQVFATLVEGARSMSFLPVPAALGATQP